MWWSGTARADRTRRTELAARLAYRCRIRLELVLVTNAGLSRVSYKTKPVLRPMLMFDYVYNPSRTARRKNLKTFQKSRKCKNKRSETRVCGIFDRQPFVYLILRK